jgi:hypothetical protein
MSEATENRAGDIGELGSAYLRRRYVILFYSLLLTMGAVPALGVLGVDPAFIELFLAANLLVAVVPLGTRRARRVLLYALMVLWAARLATIWHNDPALVVITLGMWTIVGLCAAAGALRFAMRARLVDTEHLYAALSAYLLAGIFLGLFYWGCWRRSGRVVSPPPALFPAWERSILALSRWRRWATAISYRAAMWRAAWPSSRELVDSYSWRCWLLGW